MVTANQSVLKLLQRLAIRGDLRGMQLRVRLVGPPVVPQTPKASGAE